MRAYCAVGCKTTTEMVLEPGKTIYTKFDNEPAEMYECPCGQRYQFITE